MGPKYLIDSNVIIEFLINSLPEDGVEWLIDVVNKKEHCVSPINQIEVLGYNGDASEMERAIAFVAGPKSISIDDRVVAEAINVRKQKRIKLPDAIIAATAIVHGLTIVSKNVKDFKGLKGIEVINLHGL